MGWDTPLVVLATFLIIIGVSYGMAMLMASRRQPSRAPGRRPADAPRQAPGDLFFVFLMPCLNEEKVIRASLQRLLSMSAGNFIILVIDDGSQDGTAAAVGEATDARVQLLRRALPQARQGKGEALNAALSHLRSGGLLDGKDPDQVIAVVVDADGRLDPRAIDAVTPYFTDPATGAVQIGVRINNRGQSRLARMQDMEFVIYTEVFQRGRRHLGSVGLGGNGQFMRLSALLSLGPAPWTRSLTEDLDLGVRMIAAGWRNEYCPDVAVHQQGVVEVRRLVRQRSRWFQGHLQSWRLVPLVLRKAPRRARTDLLYHLTSPAVLLIASLLSASFLVSAASAVLGAAQGRGPLGWWIATTYALTFGPAMAMSSVYWARERHEGVGALRTMALAHLYVGYGMLWYASGWRAVGRTLRGQTGWAKTDRVAESPGPAAARPPRRRRRIAVAAIAVSGCAALAVLAGVRAAHPPASEWRQAFSGYGSTSVTGSGGSAVITLHPATTTSGATTHAALVLSQRNYGNFSATVRVDTTSRLRRGPAGRPQPWEVGWVLWHYTSNDRFYALTLEPNGWLLSKQEPAYPGGERFLASGKTPVFRTGVPHAVRITQSGARITVFADGRLLTRFTDNERPYLSGAFGFYTEDAVARFDQVRVSQLPAGTH
jgi:cellulose synthase/poly-beta-1,6-N-acetylglucosamine synthase-like glycosyltransferase